MRNRKARSRTNRGTIEREADADVSCASSIITSEEVSTEDYTLVLIVPLLPFEQDQSWKSQNRLGLQQLAGERRGAWDPSADRPARSVDCSAADRADGTAVAWSGSSCASARTSGFSSGPAHRRRAPACVSGEAMRCSSYLSPARWLGCTARGSPSDSIGRRSRSRGC